MSTYMEFSSGSAFRTNQYSHPLPSHGREDWLENKVENPFLNRWDFAIDAKVNMFFSKEGRTGISMNYTLGIPFKATNTIPVGDFNTNSWEYQDYNSLQEQFQYHSFSLGAIFKVKLKSFELGSSFRLGISTLDNFNSTILSIDAEPFLNYLFDIPLYITTGFTYTSLLMKYIKDENKYYEPGFTLMSVKPYIGIGVYF